jgi:hypothetical protein
MGEFLFDPSAPAEDAKTVRIVEHAAGGDVEHRYDVVGLTRKGGIRMGALQKKARLAREKAEGNGGVHVDDVVEMEALSFITGLDITLRPVDGGKSAVEVLTALWKADALPIPKLRDLFRYVVEAQSDPPA